MINKEVIVKNKFGLESKVAARLIQKASGFKCKIWIEQNERRANAKSLLGLLSLSISQGSKIFVIADGIDEEEAVKELTDYISHDNIEE